MFLACLYEFFFVTLGWQWVGLLRELFTRGKINEIMLGIVDFISYISVVIMIDMMYKLKKYSFLTLIGLGFGFLAFLLPKAIKFFFRGFHILLEYPLEGFSFFVFLTIFISVGIYTEKKI